MKLRGRDRTVHLLFSIGVIAKGVDGALEILGGILLFILSPERINSIVRIVTEHELSEDPNDFVAHLLVQSLHHLSGGTKLFGAIFLLWHGAIKVWLVWALLRERWWAYPVAIIAFAAFVVYQLYRYTHTHSIWLIGLSILDAFVIALTWLEYKRLKGASLR
ncbi:MAG TPA: DUF2127 domain-containing protein [Gammaproteobacteria bacterium]|nr:DUF2127 domain-containing protein [Gammaproteobacteria bacterium]